MGNRDMPPETQVDIIHHLTKDLTMSTCVLNAVEVNIIMYHLVDDSVFYLVFEQIKTGAYAKTEVVKLHLTEQFPTFLIDKHPEECPGIA